MATQMLSNLHTIHRIHFDEFYLSDTKKNELTLITFLSLHMNF